MDIARIDVLELSTQHIVEHCRMRHEEGAGPATIQRDVSYIRGILSIAKPAWAIPVTTAPIDDVHEAWIGWPQQQRERRPAGKQIEEIEAALVVRQGLPQSNMSLLSLFRFSIF